VPDCGKALRLFCQADKNFRLPMTMKEAWSEVKGSKREETVGKTGEVGDRQIINCQKSKGTLWMTPPCPSIKIEALLNF
jgi:hypothetical protein